MLLHLAAEAPVVTTRHFEKIMEVFDWCPGLLELWNCNALILFHIC